jgi:SAM-dependent methyltransferase
MRETLKSLLSALGLRGIARWSIAKLKRPLRRTVNAWLILKNKLGGGTQADFFEILMDQRARSGGIFGKPPEAVTGWPDEHRRQFAAKFLTARGWISPSTRMLDYGCGNAATGVNFIRVLDAGRYTGADLSAGVLDRAREWVQKLGLAQKKPEFIHLAGGSLDPLKGRQFDFVYCQDVVTHMTPEFIIRLIKAAPSFMAPKAIFLITYTHSDVEILEEGDDMNWCQNWRFFAKAAEGTPLICEEVSEWSGVEYKNQPLNRMVRLRMPAT